MIEHGPLKAWRLALLGVSLAAAPVMLGAQSAAGREHSGGIWKAAVPPRPMHGEFQGFDPLGIAAGAKIQADCSLNWIDPDDGKLYCFSSGTSLEYFLDAPRRNLERATQGWRKMTAP